MFDFIPLDQYYSIYINLCLGMVLFTLLHSYVLPIESPRNIFYLNCLGYLILVFIIFYMGTRPLSSRHFGDMVTYNNHFTSYATGGEVDASQDALFNYFMKMCSYVMTSRMFFTLCALIYILPLYRVSRVFFKEYWFYCFLMFITSFSFWTYGTNGIRNGMSTSLFLLAVSFYRNKMIMITLMILASQVHQTMFLPIFAFVVAWFYTKPKTYLMVWFAAIPLSIALGGFWESLFASLGFADDRLGAYLIGEKEEGLFKSTGFRYDFLFYSAGAVFTGWYYIFKKNFNDKIYLILYSTYVICNAFWILVIRANFSNRFAYLSWFMMALVIVYPFIKQQLNRQHILLGRVVFLYFAFTYLMVYIYYGIIRQSAVESTI